mmetsp:Transcript_39353/g.95236  ORF Transcript_39353/g.95236 Transcript_39353/m.95236 type:complete len:80 (-) Transcript_39353:75-314(-)
MQQYHQQIGMSLRVLQKMIDPGKRAPKPERLNDIPARKEDTFHHRTMATIKHCTLFNNKKVKHKWAGDRVLFSIPIETP